MEGDMMRGPCFRSALVAAAIGIAGFLCGPAASAQTAGTSPPASSMPALLPGDPRAIIDATRKRVAAGDLDGAARALAVYVAAHPEIVEPARYLGDLYYRQADFASAERIYLQVLRYHPDERATHDRLGGIYAAQDRIQDAVNEFTKSLPNPAGYGHLVDLHRRLGDLADFEFRYRRAADGNIDDAKAQYAYGVILVDEHRPAEAIPYLQQALSLTMTPQACSPLAALGSAYLDLGWTDKAVDVLEDCLARDRENYDSLVNLSAAYLGRQELVKAREVLDHANSLRPDGVEALINLGYLEDEENDWNKAVEYYLRAIAVDPFARDAYVDLGFDYDQHRLYPLAQAAYLKGLSVSPGDGRLHYLLGVIYVEQGKLDLARAEFERATKSNEPEISREAARRLAQI